MRYKLIEMLKVHEGVESHAYECSASKITVGVGRNIDPEGGIGLSEDEINYLLQNDIDRVYAELDSEYSWFSFACLENFSLSSSEVFFQLSSLPLLILFLSSSDLFSPFVGCLLRPVLIALD